MANKRPKPEEIAAKLRRVKVLMGKGTSRICAIRQIGVVEQTCSRLRKDYGGMGPEHLKGLNRPQKENKRLRRALSDLTLGKHVAEATVNQDRTATLRSVAQEAAPTPRRSESLGYPG